VTARDRAAVAGVGYTEFSLDSGVTTMTLATRAIRRAIEDAGLSVADIDGLATYSMGDSVGPSMVAPALGLTDLSYLLHQVGGGTVSHGVIGNAMLAVASGQSEVVVVYRALNGRSGHRLGGTGTGLVNVNVETPYKISYGLFSAAQEFALAARQHMVKYGTTSEHLGQIAVNQRAFAVQNERAIKRSPITLDDYLSSRWIVDPFRLLDCCLESDGACAVVVVSAERARDLRQHPVLISGAAWGIGHTMLSNGWPDQTQSAVIHTAPRLYRMAGLRPQDVDIAMLYDCFTYSVLVQVEDFGFCDKGDGGPFIASGATAEGGSIPVNTHGGFLSEAYVHGLNHFCEAVQQLRHQCGDRQVPGAQVALSTGQPGLVGGESSAVLLRRADR
jgi:acetyl-CoA acetyltransferase